MTRLIATDNAIGLIAVCAAQRGAARPGQRKRPRPDADGPNPAVKQQRSPFSHTVLNGLGSV